MFFKGNGSLKICLEPVGAMQFWGGMCQLEFPFCSLLYLHMLCCSFFISLQDWEGSLVDWFLVILLH